jgi:phage gp37-like protein
MEFNDYVGGIETGILGVLITELLKSADHPDRYLKEIGAYNGELDEKTLRANLEELQSRMPAMLVAYVDGNDQMMPATSPVGGQPRSFRHDCTFTVICCAEDARGRTAQKQGAPGGTGVYRMIADVRSKLGGLWLIRRGEQIVTRAGDRRLQDGEQLLTFSPLTIAGVDYLARLPDITCYGVSFETYFNWTEPDRRGAGTAVSELAFEVASTGSAEDQGALPGVNVK